MVKRLVVAGTTGVLGINTNQYVHHANELLSATNVWAPNGVLTNRPGVYPHSGLIAGVEQYQVHDMFFDAAEGVAPAPLDITTVAGVVPVTNAGNAWYFTVSTNGVTVEELHRRSAYLYFNLNSAAVVDNSTLVASFYYWNGADWAPCFGYAIGAAASGFGSRIPSVNLNGVGSLSFAFCVVLPSEATRQLVNSASPPDFEAIGVNANFFLKILFLDGTPAGDTIPSFTNFLNNSGYLYAAPVDDTDYFFAIDTMGKTTVGNSSSTYFTYRTHRDNNSGFPSAMAQGGLALDFSGYNAAGVISVLPAGDYQGLRMCSQSVPDTGEVYIVERSIVYKWTWDQMASGQQSISVAEVESRSDFVGENAPYSTSYIAQESVFPGGDFITYWQGRLWLADRQTIRWSAPFPYHNVWPLLSQEPIATTKGERLTGMRGLQQSMHVFTESSIYRVTPAGEDDFGLQVVTIDKPVSGIGAVADSSIVDIGGRLVFLGEEAVWVYDGTPALVDATVGTHGQRRLVEIFRSINPTARKYATACYWRKYNCYLLAVPLGSSSRNNAVLVWDITTNSWWKWDLEVSCWYVDNADNSNETVTFAAYTPLLYDLKVGIDDYYEPMECEITTHRFGLEDTAVKRFTQVMVDGSNSTASCTIKAYNNAETQQEIFSQAVDYTDYHEATWPADNLVDKFVPDTSRTRRVGMSASLMSMTVKVETSSRDSYPLKVARIAVAYGPTGAKNAIA